MPIRILIGGPPNSGKSTLAESLARALRAIGVDAYAEDLDLAIPTLEFIKGKERVGTTFRRKTGMEHGACKRGSINLAERF